MHRGSSSSTVVHAFFTLTARACGLYAQFFVLYRAQRTQTGWVRENAQQPHTDRTQRAHAQSLTDNLKVCQQQMMLAPCSSEHNVASHFAHSAPLCAVMRCGDAARMVDPKCTKCRCHLATSYIMCKHSENVWENGACSHSTGISLSLSLYIYIHISIFFQLCGQACRMRRRQGENHQVRKTLASSYDHMKTVCAFRARDRSASCKFALIPHSQTISAPTQPFPPTRFDAQTKWETWL